MILKYLKIRHATGLVATSLVIGVMFAVIFLRSNYTVSALQEPVEYGSLTWLAQDAQANGQQNVDISTLEWTYSDIDSSDDAISRYSVILAVPIDKTSYVWSDENQTIGSWYKLRVDEILSQRSYSACDVCPPPPDPPAELTANSNEILLPKYGGSVVLNGVTINSLDPDFPDYSFSASYLIFLDLDSGRRVGVVGSGPAGVFAVQGDTLVPVTPRSNPLASDIATRYGNSLSQLRAALQ